MYFVEGLKICVVGDNGGKLVWMMFYIKLISKWIIV